MSEPNLLSPVRPYADVADDVWNAVVAGAGDEQTEAEFADALLALEETKLRPNGLTLALSRTGDGWLSVLVKDGSRGLICTAFEFLRKTRQFRPFSRVGDYLPGALPASWRA